MSLITDAIRHNWEYYKQRPFGRLVRLFVARIFRGGGDSDSDGLDLGIGLVLTVLAMPGGFVSILLFEKYGSLLQWLRGVKNVDTLQIAFPDEYFFIVLSMTVTGAVAVWRWNSIFPDRRDYVNLVHLPVSTRTIFLANLLAIAFLGGLVALDVNAASCILFPMVVTAAQSQFLFFVKFAIVHALGVVLSSIFSFLVVFCLLGLLMAILPPKAFRRISAYARGIVVIYLVTLLCTSFVVPEFLRRSSGPIPAWTYLAPSCWFVSLCQMWRGRASPAMEGLARLAIPALLLFAITALLAYTIGYQRHFLRIAELSDTTSTSRRLSTRFWRILDQLVLRTPAQRGCFQFVEKTLLRSESHRLILTAVAGLAVVLASQSLMGAFDGKGSLRQAALSPDALSIPFILSFLMIFGLRFVFEIPVELRANWIFQLLLDADRQECESLARKIVLLSVLPPIAVITLFGYIYLEGTRIAVLHTGVVLTGALLLTNLMLIRFRKLPFTCTLPVFKQHSIVILISFCFGYLIYAISIPEFEASALSEPVRMLILLPLAAATWYVAHYLNANTIDLDKRLIFEEPATPAIERLRLSE